MTDDPVIDHWATRQFNVHEAMDAPEVDARQLRSALAFIRRVNFLLGYTKATIGHLDRLTKGWPAGRSLRVLDVATGSADVPQAIERWAKRRGLRVEATGLDLHEATLAIAGESAPGVSLVRGDALALPFDNGAFDVVTSSMFLHHLPTELAVAALREMRRVAAGHVIVADLLRDRRAYAWITLFTLPTSRLVRHDARVSVKQAFTIVEVQDLCASAGMNNAVVHRHFGHRFVMTAGAKSE